MLITITDLYAAGASADIRLREEALNLCIVIPRIKLRNRSGLETIQQHIVELQEVIGTAEHDLNANTVHQLLSSIAALAMRAYSWLEADPQTDAAARKVCYFACLVNCRYLPCSRAYSLVCCRIPVGKFEEQHLVKDHTQAPHIRLRVYLAKSTCIWRW